MRPATEGVDGVGWEEYFIPKASASAERLWWPVENALGRVIRRCIERTPLTSADLDWLRVAIALHFVRNPKTRVPHQQSYENARASVTSRIASHIRMRPDFAVEFQRRHSGLLPAPGGSEAAAILAEDLAESFDNDQDSGLIWRNSIECLFKRVPEVLARSSIEVLHPESGEFLIGDSPVIVTNEALGKGPADHLALGDATQIYMPLAPEVMIALGPNHAIGEIPAALVRQVNVQQIQAARKQVFMRPDSGLVNLVREIKWPT